MKLPVRILLVLLCAALILAMPFVLSSPNMLNDIKMELMNDGEEEIDFGRLFLSTARAEDELEEETLDEGEFSSHPEWALPLDFSVPPEPKADQDTENGDEDESIRVKIEHQEMDDGTKMHVAYVQIADASQLRTGVANPEKLGSSRTSTVSALAKKYNAVIAINGDNYVDAPKKTTFEYRMTEKIRSKTNNLKDILIIDDLGDFHLFIKSQGLHKDDKPYFVDTMKAEGRKVVNAFTFGPALVKDGELLTIDEHYGYNPHGREPRTAIGQTGPLSYVMVLVEGRTSGNDKAGTSQQKLAQIMYDLGCIQAYNLDGGNTSEMIMCGPADEYGKLTEKFYYEGDQVASDRQQKDIIYFATAVPESEW
jgi:exopolysaccharide biosynthesis protein